MRVGIQQEDASNRNWGTLQQLGDDIAALEVGVGCNLAELRSAVL